MKHKLCHRFNQVQENRERIKSFSQFHKLENVISLRIILKMNNQSPLFENVM
jgi:hypothetical protein